MFNLEDLYLHRIAYADFDGVGFDGWQFLAQTLWKMMEFFIFGFY